MKRACAAAACAVLVFLTACHRDPQRHSDDGAPPPPPPQNYTVGGSVTGLSGAGLALRIDDGETLAISSNGTFTFPTALTAGTSFNVAVAAQPANPAQICTVTSGAGTITADVTTVAVVCATSAHTLGGTVSGLVGTGLSLASGTGENLSITGDGEFVFPTEIADGAAYNVTIGSQPAAPAQTCTPTHGSGTITADVNNVAIACTTNIYRIGGSVSGLIGSGLVLQVNGGNDLPITANGAFNFMPSFIDGELYTVGVSIQPSGPLQTCVVGAGSGTISASDVNVNVTCTVDQFTVGGVVSGLVGHDMVLNNGTEQLTVDANGGFTFPTALDVGASYDVTIDHSPGAPAQRCVVANSGGTLGAANVTNVSVTCQPPMYSTFMLTANAANDSVSLLAVNADRNLLWRRSAAAGDTPADVAIYKGGGLKHFAYAANYNSNNVSAFSYDTREGTLEAVPGGTYYSGDAPRKMTVHPTRPFIYVANQVGFDVRMFSIDEATGALTDRGAIPLAAATVQILIEPTGHYAYILADQVASTLRTYSIDQTTGVLAEVPSSAYPMPERSGGMTFDGESRHLYVFNPTTDTIHAYALDAASGRPQPIAGSPFATGGADLNFLALHPNGRLIYAVPPASLRREEGITVFSLQANGAPRRVAGSPFASGADAETAQLDPTGRYLYTNEFKMPGWLLHKYAVDTATGALTSHAATPIDNASNTEPPLFDATGERLYQIGNGSILTYGIDHATGALSSSNWGVTHAGSGTFALAIDTDSAPLTFVSDTVVTSSQFDNRVSSFRLSANGALALGSIESEANPTGITLDPAGRVAHVMGPGFGVSLFGIDPGTSGLTNFGYDLPVSTPAPAVFSSTGRYAYVANKSSTTLRTYLMDPATGDWEGTSLPTVTLSTAVEQAMVHPNGRFYTRPIADGTANESRMYYYPIDFATGAVASGGNYAELSGPMGSWALHPSGNFMYVVKPADNVIQTYSVAPGGYLLPLGADIPFVANGENALEMDPRGRFLFALKSTGYVETFAIGADGRLTSLGAPNVARATAMATDLSGNYLVVADGGFNRVTVYRIGADGTLTYRDFQSTPLAAGGVHAVKVSGRLQ
ncbi:beta-propeller fold lactonase family protein [Steroidobacter flavus]|uniref:Beta-propeller fold lactonase family protein n=1 Tax=Steroidobacter flavus TaxID=1842136 RepID=A0ABV8SL70_9GAMM